MVLNNFIIGLQIIQERQPDAQWKNHACGIMVKFDDFLWNENEVSKLESMGWYEHDSYWILLQSK